ncbi:MAG: hypothetical protein COY81_03205 [Candidatus Pacebacteria bacterium CG_4_10_14_0_8_um_filter_43_12]|nr:MAG: hypothetical protein COY81_03205 [Candidatus Pacebacteria bacterium CG_4_10_14_0_8_um_filter_43_12]
MTTPATTVPLSSSLVEAKANQRALFFLAAVMLVNALSYGTIIPLLYPYTARFGIDAFGLSMLFVSFSLFQFLATPIIGRLSDIYGRRPLLLISLFGTSLSLALFASATSIWMLFLARILDGITGGNMSVAQAVIADRLHGKERAKAFGLLGASFGFGFLAGPAIGGLLSEISLTAPFWFASGLALLATVFGYFFLKESLHPDHRSEHGTEPVLNFHKLFSALKLPVRGLLLLTVLMTSLAHNDFILGFQSFTNDILKLSPKTIGLLFASFGVVSIIMQGVGIRFLLTHVKNHEKIILVSQISSAVVVAALALTHSLLTFAAVLFFYMFVSSPIFTIVQSMISERTDPTKQGEVLGISSSYMSLGQIIGPTIAGLLALTNIRLVFVAGGLLYGISFLISWWASAKAQLHARVTDPS